MSDRWVESLKVVELRDELKKRGLSTTGVKAVLVERLSAALKEIAKADQVEAKADDPGSSDAADAVEQNGEEKKQSESGVETQPEPAANQPAAVAEPAPKPKDVEEAKKPEPEPQPKPAPLISPRDDPMEEPMTVNSLLDEAGEGEGTEQPDDHGNSDQEAEPEPEAPKAAAKPEPAAKAERPAAAKRPAPEREDSGKASEEGKVDDSKSSEKRNKRQPIQFQPPERKQSIAKPSEEPALESPKPSPQPASASKPEAAAAAAAAPQPQEAAATAAGTKELPAPKEPLSKRLKVDTTQASPAEQASTPAPLTAEAERTRLLYIAGLVRPFTEPALRQLLSRTGSLQELWLPPLKTHAIAVFETEQQAETTRQAINLLKWPLGSAKVLQPKFITVVEADKEKAIHGGATVVTPRARGGGVIAALKASQQAARGAGPAGSSNSTTAVAAAAAAAAAADVARIKVEAKDGAAKEKEKEKGAEPAGDAGPGASGEVPADGGREKREPTPMAVEEDEEEPMLRLEDLFRKTVAKPQIYYLPLTAEQVGEKKRKAAEQALPAAAAAAAVEQPGKEREGGGGGGAAGESRRPSERRSRERERRRSRSREHGSRR